MKRINAHIIFIAAILVLSLFFFRNILQSGYILYNIHYINDLTFVSYNVKEALKSNELALWTPYFYAGHPLLAIPEYYMFDFNFLLIYLLKDIYLAMNISLVFYLFIAGLGMYSLVFSLMGSKRASFIAAAIFMFNGFMQSFVIGGHINILEGYALMPFIMLFTHKALKGKDWIFHSIIAGMFFALQILSGSIIFFFYTALLVGIYAAVNLVSKNFLKIMIKSLLVGLVVCIVAISLSAIKLLPVLEFTKMSSRAAGVSFNEFLGSPISLGNIARVAITNIGYGDISGAIGIIGFIFLLYGLFYCKKRMIAFSVILAVVALLIASGTFLASLMYKLPGFSSLRHVERLLALFVFGASLLSAYGFASASEKLRSTHYAKYERIFFAVVVVLILAELLFLHKLPQSDKVIQPDEIGILEYIGKDNSYLRTYNFAQKDIVGAAGYNYYAQKGISEVKGGGGIWVNDYVGFLYFAQQYFNPKVFGILNVKYFVSDVELNASGIALIKKFKECKECAVWNAFGPYLYKNELFLPRYFIVPNSILVLGDNNMVKQLVNSMVFQNLEPKHTVLVEGTNINDYGIDFLKKFNTIILLKDSIDQNSIDKLKEYANSGGKIIPDILNGKNSISNDDINIRFNNTKGYTEIKVKEYSFNKVVLGLSGEKGWLVASERFAHFPGWRASLNGNEVRILKANSVISAVNLDGSKGELIFEYYPDSYKKGKYISIFALLMISVYIGYFTNKKIKQKSEVDKDSVKVNPSQP